MVSALLNDALSDPCSILIALHNDHSLRVTPQQLSSRVAQYFRDIFKDDDAFKEIPALTVSHPPECFLSKRLPLVRFRAMVQDTSSSPEVYPSSLSNSKPGGWGLAEGDATDELVSLEHLNEREVVWAVNVPGESPFVAELLDDPDAPGKRRLLPCRKVVCKPASVYLASSVGSTSQLLYKDPLMRANHVGVQVKLYDATVGPLKPTELHTFVGLLTVEHLSSGEVDAHGELQVPTLHTLFSVKHSPSLVPFKYFPPRDVISSSLTHSQMDLSPATIRDELVQWISDQALGGDHDAALWVLLIAIARVFPRLHGNVSISPTASLTYVLRRLLPIFVDVPLTLPLLNTSLFSPESRDEKLHAGLLQLPAGTTILLSDSGVQEGSISETGIKNIQALQNALTNQTIDYHFPFSSPYQFPTDLSFIVLTEGKKSAFIETLVNIPLNTKRPHDCFRHSENIREPPADRMDAFRRFLGSAKIGDVKITDEISQYIQEDFVRERQMDKTINGDDLMLRLSIARLLALLLHSTVLTVEIWQEAKELDQRRKGRF